jgi:rhodanese-related sulfurtransferase
LPRGTPVVTVCAAGMRASMAGSVLKRDWRENVRLLDSGGTQDRIGRGYPVATGDE